MSNKLNQIDLEEFARIYKREVAHIWQAQDDRRYLIREEGAKARNAGQFPPCGVDLAVIQARKRVSCAKAQECLKVSPYSACPLSGYCALYDEL